MKSNNYSKRIGSVFIAVAMIFTTHFAFPINVNATDTETARTFVELKDAIDNVHDGGTITITEPITMTETIYLDKSITVTGETLTRGNTKTYAFFDVKANATLTLENITLDGKRESFSHSPLLRSLTGGTIVINDGAILTNNYQGGANTGCVLVDDGKLIMNGGEISGNSGSFGGGVMIWAGEFIMNDGKIVSNTAEYGGGVEVLKGEFTMNGGEISDNTATKENGGGVFIGRGDFTFNGGKITGNSAYNYGGGVAAYDGTFTMSGGIISNNHASWCGGVYISKDKEFAMSGGVIHNNTNITGGGDLSMILTENAISPSAVCPECGKTFVGWYYDKAYTIPILNFPEYNRTAYSRYDYTYNFTINNGTASTNTSTHPAGRAISIKALDPPKGMVFNKWTSTGGGSFANANSINTTYIMPANETTIEAVYKPAPINNPLYSTDTIEPVSINAAKGKVYMTRGTKLKMPYSIYPASVSNEKVVWQTTNKKVAKVNHKGVISIPKKVKTGRKAIITAKTSNGKVSKITVIVSNRKVAVKNLKITNIPKKKTLTVGKAVTLKTTMKSAKATNVVPKWSSSNREVLKIDKAGKVIAVNKGTATIKAKVGKKSKSVKITVL